MPDENGVFVVFYAWQSDTPEHHNKNLISSALRRVAHVINSDGTFPYKVRIDRDTQGVPGLCDIPAEIIRKIENCDVFFADFTLIGTVDTRDDTDNHRQRKRLPNPNVVLETGYAAKSVGFERIILVMNDHYGKPQDQMFDIKHRRFPITYTCPADGLSQRATARQLVDSVVEPIKDAIRFAASNVADKNGVDIELAIEGHGPVDDASRVEISPLVPITLHDYNGPNNPMGYRIPRIPMEIGVNTNYYRELAAYAHWRTGSIPFYVTVRNRKQSSLRDMEIRVSLPRHAGEMTFDVMPNAELPDLPPKDRDILYREIPIRRQFSLGIKRTENEWLIVARIRCLHAKASESIDCFNIAPNMTGVIPISITAHADGLIGPSKTGFNLPVTVTPQQLTISEISKRLDD